MDKAQLASYLCNLQTIVEGQEDAATPRSTTLTDEYNRTFAKLKETIKKEHEDEAGKSGR